MKLGNEEQSVRFCTRALQQAMNAIFDADYATAHNIVIKVRTSNRSFMFELSAPRRSHEASDAKRAAYAFST
ncbi:hypothetical protein ACFP56_01055 [Paenibacillus septentrionalis]|uniref:Uncharacterized protein n=1 Tax=Paenibacillus septentrionalis TaxID=429342 RepID=A0ABW1V0H7_9BACL